MIFPILFSMTLVNTSPGTLHKLMPLELPHSLRSPFLWIGIIMAFFQSCGVSNKYSAPTLYLLLCEARGFADRGDMNYRASSLIVNYR